MKARIASIAIVLFMGLFMVPMAWATNSEPAHSSSKLETTITLPPITLPVVTVTLPPVTVPGPVETIRLPGETVTVTNPVPGPTKTIVEPAETVTAPGATVTVRPSERPSEAPEAGPTETVTVNTTETGQPEQESGTIEPDEPKIDLSRPGTALAAAGIGFAILVIAMIISLWGGYALGYKDRERKEARFLMALRQQLFGKSTGR